MTSPAEKKYSCIQRLIFQTSMQKVWETVATFECQKQTLDALRFYPLDQEVRALLDDERAIGLGHLTVDINPPAEHKPSLLRNALLMNKSAAQKDFPSVVPTTNTVQLTLTL